MRNFGSIVVLAVLGLATFATGCSKKSEAAQEPMLAPSASALAASTAEPAAGVTKFTIDPKGKTAIDMPGPSEHIKAGTEAAAGDIEVLVTDVTKTRGTVKVDLTTLSTHTFGNDDDASQTRHALTWLEVGDVAPPDKKEDYRWVVYAIRSIDNASATDVSKIAPTKDGGDDVRTVTVTAHGDLLLHGHQVTDRKAELEVKMRWPSGASAQSKPSAIEIKSKSPLVITLAEHDVKPRDTVGKIAKGSFFLLGTKVANTAAVTLDLRATPASS